MIPTIVMWVVGSGAFLVALIIAGMGLTTLFDVFANWGYYMGTRQEASIFIGLLLGIVALSFGMVGVILLPALAFGGVTLQELGAKG